MYSANSSIRSSQPGRSLMPASIDDGPFLAPARLNYQILQADLGIFDRDGVEHWRCH